MRRYTRRARWYRLTEPALLFPHRMRKRAITRLELLPGQTVLEIGCGTGRSLALLGDAVGEGGEVIGVDVSRGMLARAERWAKRNDRQNVRLLLHDAVHLSLRRPVDAVLFSLSYSALPDRAPALDVAWRALAPAGKLVIMDARLPPTRLGRLLRPAAETLATVFPGDPYSTPWNDLSAITPSVQTEWFRRGLYFICSARKPAAAS
jgi:demethylmenaquinone methyltransferase/2-methoxy-6-polyprenyl-1,4-benzoquinol methylase